MSGTRDRDLVMEAPPSPGVATVSAISPFWRHNTATGHKEGHRRSVHSDGQVEMFCIIPFCQRNVQP